jgi:acetyltransferase-like isoleucine patch superfamily enzyme
LLLTVCASTVVVSASRHKEEKMSDPVFAPGQAVDVATLSRHGLQRAGDGCVISPLAVFVPGDYQRASRPVQIGDGCHIGPFAIIYGGAILSDGARLEEHVIVGKPEYGYAVGHAYPGAGAATSIGPGTVVRAGAVVYAGTEVAADAVIGHHTLLRSFVAVGEQTQLGHHLTIERATRIGAYVRCSPGSHITGSCVLADRVFLGAGVRTVNDRQMIWRDPDREPELIPPSFGYGARVGSGCTILAGVVIGEHALVGAGSVVTRHVPPGAVAYGVPARVRAGAESAPS